MRRGAWIALAALVGIVSVAEGKDRDVVEGDLGSELDAVVRRVGGSSFWGSVLVAREGKILLAKGYGFADYGRTPNTSTTLHEIASCSKQVTATAILHLEQRKKLSVSDTIDRFFDGVPPDKKGITLHQLLTHTSGISGRIGVPYTSTLPRKPYVERMMAEALASEPGTKFEYSNVGYALLAAVVEEVSGRSFEEYCERHLFAKARCADTGFISDRDLIKSGRASTRKDPNHPGSWTAAHWNWGWGYRGMGGVVTTVHDLLRWDRALRADDVLGEDARTKLYTPEQASYACGWRVEVTERGTRKVSHTGGVAGYGANLVRWLEDDVAIFVLSNHGKPAYEIPRAMESLLFRPVSLTVVIDRKGYELGAHRSVKLPELVKWDVRKQGSNLVLRLRDRNRVPLEIRAPASYGRKLLSALEQAIAAREADDEGGPAAVEAGLYLSRFPPSRRLELTEKLEVAIEPEYRGQDGEGNVIVDKRVLFVVRDAKHGQWPFMAKLNVAAAKALLEALRRAVR